MVRPKQLKSEVLDNGSIVTSISRQHLPAAASCVRADGSNNDMDVYAAQYFEPTATEDGMDCRRIVCVTSGHDIELVWQVFVPAGQSDQASSNPFAKLHYKLTQSVATAIEFKIRNSAAQSATEVTATGSTVGTHETISILWSALSSFLTGSEQLLEVRVKVTLDNAADEAFIGGVDFFWQETI